ncbi:MAG: hypothetical protein U1F46_15455 [Marinagarivorans sp.]
MLVKHYIRNIFCCFLISSAVGCATVQKPIAFDLKPDPSKTIGIVKVAAPEAAAQYTGSIGLLDLAIISGANAGLNKHLKTQSFAGDFQKLPQDVTNILKAKGFKVSLIEQDIDQKEAAKLGTPSNGAIKYNFSRYKNESGLTHLLILAMPAVGTTRGYYGPVPLSEPTAQTVVRALLVDLNTNKLSWYTSATSTKVIEKPWDESDKKWPNLTNAVFGTVDEATKLIKAELENPQLVTPK